MFGRADAEHIEAVFEHLTGGHQQSKTRRAQLRIFNEHALGVVERMKVRSQVFEIDADQVRRKVAGGNGKRLTVLSQSGSQCRGLSAVENGKVGAGGFFAGRNGIAFFRSLL